MTLCLYLSPGGGMILEKDGAEVTLSRQDRLLLRILLDDRDRFKQTRWLSNAIWASSDVNRSTDPMPVSWMSWLVVNLRAKAGPRIIETGDKRSGSLRSGYRLGPCVRVFSILGEIARAPGAIPEEEAA